MVTGALCIEISCCYRAGKKVVLVMEVREVTQYKPGQTNYWRALPFLESNKLSCEKTRKQSINRSRYLNAE